MSRLLKHNSLALLAIREALGKLLLCPVFLPCPGGIRVICNPLCCLQHAEYFRPCEPLPVSPWSWLRILVPEICWVMINGNSGDKKLAPTVSSFLYGHSMRQGKTLIAASSDIARDKDEHTLQLDQLSLMTFHASSLAQRNT
jgi:hypothetical protein